ncbi:unnamed protein product [Clonostachys rosea f. rosea IK726]|uniref:Uncharacterized protein n=1 Tax=Clonostachys rosea f. rosea IK726 TaxID=1349383 RepID=A0ACA9ULJ1_BIOOC|nr:unnamed protein product [Clonostachys rosea f. rosea IK726]
MTFFKSKVVLITGSGGGLGRHLAVFAQKVDVADEESVKGLFKAAVNKFGRIDVVVNNAAIFDALAQEPQGGNIVNVGSIAGLKGYLLHALRGMTMNIASYYGKKGIRCNLVQPGGMDTELYKNSREKTTLEGLNLLMGNCQD